MRYIKLLTNTVVEIIPGENPDLPGVPITERYPAEFLATCVLVEDTIEVLSGYIYDSDTNTFSIPVEPESPAIPTIGDDPGIEVPIEPTLEEKVATLQAKLEAVTQSNAFLEECVVEMAGIVYA